MSRDYKVNLSVVRRVNVLEITYTSRFRVFVRMNPSISLGSKVGVNPHELLDGVYNVLSFMGVSSREKEKIASNKLRDVSLL